MFSPVSALKIVLFFVCCSEKQRKIQQNKHGNTIHLQKIIKAVGFLQKSATTK